MIDATKGMIIYEIDGTTVYMQKDELLIKKTSFFFGDWAVNIETLRKIVKSYDTWFEKEDPK